MLQIPLSFKGPAKQLDTLFSENMIYQATKLILAENIIHWQHNEALETINAVIEEIKRTLGQTPPELAADIVERGIVMTGGGSLLKGLPKLISKETGVPVILAEDPLLCVANGAGMYYEHSKDAANNKTIYNNLNT